MAEGAPGRALFTLACVEYLDTDCGTYLETAQAFFIERPGAGFRLPWISTWSDVARNRGASFTWALQVTTVLSQRCGIEMWGFPKTVERIELEEEGDRVRFSMSKEGRLVFQYSVEAKGDSAPKPGASDVFSIFEGAPHVGQLHQTWRDMGVKLGGGELELGDHPMADEMRALGLPKRPLLSTWAGHLAFEMSAPRKL